MGPPGGGARLGMLRRAGVRARDGGQWQQQAVRREHVPHVAGPQWAAREPAKAARPAVPVLHDQLRKEAEMRYCYARLLSVGNPSGPVKFSGQPQYDSEQVVSPLFTFSAPPMEGEGAGEGEGEEGEAAAKEMGAGALLAAPQQQQLAAPQAPQQQLLRQASRIVQLPEVHKPQQIYQKQKQQQIEEKPRLPPPTSIVQPEPQGGARIITPIELDTAAKVNPQSEWAAFEAVQKASKSEWMAAQQQAKQKVHAAANAKMSAAQGLLPRLNALPKMTAQHSAQLAQAGPWYDKEQALAI
eukprot:CAMPEP_0179453544 /NCGR_PEP_ID=MMETSP0799-20121207/37521_1 /TAXON_ID=46947 /ORGANISM="Geminigera cryophila, Strain CCMP2564" /LENGTH=297 /DNA_ID=CAMNT_0021250755 /DNA_START=137 /DNA_END=1031 /DNA_ORIENTATION=-